MVDRVKIGGRDLGGEAGSFVIAEAGVNHNGRKDLALALVEAAHAAGADCVKFQTFAADRVANRAAAKAPYQEVTTGSAGSQIEMLKALELPEEAYPEIVAACRDLGIVFLSTPYSPEDADFLEGLGVSAYKAASAQVVELSFLEHLGRKQRPILLSTGMATLAEVDDAVRAVRSTGNKQLVLLQCTTNYPSRIDDANLRVLRTLRESFGLPVGYSDHTDTATCCIGAIAMGAVVIEKHLTLDKRMPGPDHQASADPEEFRRLVASIREVERALGTGRKEPTAEELANLAYMRRSVVAREPIAAGTLLTADLLTFKRPGTGISPARLAEVVGGRTRVAMERDHLVQWDDLTRERS